MSTENLKNQEAIQKLKDMVDSIDISMLGSRCPDHEPLHFVPMSRQEVDDDGNIWFLTSADSQTCQNISKNNKVTLVYSDVKNYNFLVVEGEGEISKDQARIDKYWNKFMEAWFEKGKEDPNIRILKVNTNDAQYWDNKTNKFVTFIKMATSAITGAKMDIGREGKLDL